MIDDRNLTQNLRAEFNGRIAFRERRPGVIQVLAPLFHEDGDMIDIFLDLPTSENQSVLTSDHGMTLMRLSYSYEIDTATKRKILDRIWAENGVSEDRGRFFMETTLSQHTQPFFNLGRLSPKSATCKRSNAKSYKAFFMTRWMTSARVI